jgi:hypothetical protein
MRNDETDPELGPSNCLLFTADRTRGYKFTSMSSISEIVWI